jgi:hypothetical protein
MLLFNISSIIHTNSDFIGQFSNLFEFKTPENSIILISKWIIFHIPGTELIQILQLYAIHPSISLLVLALFFLWAFAGARA